MDHGPSTDWGEDRAAEYKTRLGIRMFIVYLVVYAGFVVINSVRPELMGKVLGGLNLAVLYGIGLIVFALIIAFIYNALSGRAEEQTESIYSDDETEEF